MEKGSSGDGDEMAEGRTDLVRFFRTEFYIGSVDIAVTDTTHGESFVTLWY